MKQNHFFSSPKRRTLAIVVAAVVVVGGITTGAALSLRHEPGVFPGQVNDGNVPASAAGETLSQDSALQIALEHAGIGASDAVVTKNHLDFDDGIYEYEIEFFANNREYDYTINAQTGEIRSYEISTLQSGTGSTPAQGYLSQDAAYEAALSDAGISADQAVLLKAELDLDDGVMGYEVEFFSNGIEYEYTLDAATGAILSKSQERAD